MEGTKARTSQHGRAKGSSTFALKSNSALPGRAALGFRYVSAHTETAPTRHLLPPEMNAPVAAAPDDSTELTEALTSMVMVTPVAGHDKMVSSAMTSMSSTAAGKTEEGRGVGGRVEDERVAGMP